MEIEATFRVTGRSIFVDVRQLTTLGPYDLEPIPGIEHQHNTYFDTPDRRLDALRYTLRVRDLGSHRIATVKHSLGMRMGIHRREEWETAIGAGDHPCDWPASVARERALAVLAGASISPLVTIRTRRQYIYALREGSRRAEISLDEGAIMAGGRAIGFRELKVELLADGIDADLDALIGCLHARFPLTPEPRGKRARGMALLDRAFGGLASAAHLAPVVTALEQERAFAVGAR
jgi:inorganic triphosphatase YgiF